MIADAIARQGRWFSRRRNYVLLAFVPLAMLVVTQPEPIETTFGQLADTLYESVCIALAFVGLGIGGYVAGHLPEGTAGLNAATQVADTLNTSGLYSLTRNPVHFGKAVTYMAIACFLQNVWFAALMLLFLIIYFERIIATEEKFLDEKFGDGYRHWAAKVPAFFPRRRGWRAAEVPFSFRTALRHAYPGLFAIIAVLFVLDQSREYLTKTQMSVDTGWLAALVVAAFAYVVLHWAKKRTRLLSEPNATQRHAGVQTPASGSIKTTGQPPAVEKTTVIVQPPTNGTNYWTVKVIERPEGDWIVHRFYGPDSAERAYVYADSLRAAVPAELAGPYEDALKMIRQAVETLFGSAAKMPSVEAIGPTPADHAEEIVAALQRVATPEASETKPSPK